MANLIPDPNFTGTGNPTFWETYFSELNYDAPSNDYNFSKGVNLPPNNTQTVTYVRAFFRNIPTTDNYYFKIYVYAINPQPNSLIIDIGGNDTQYTPQSGWNYYTIPPITFVNQNFYITISNQTNPTTNTKLFLTDAYFGTSNEYCFNKGTKILCIVDDIEQYIPIEQLKNGDLVKTYLHGYRKIDNVMRSIFKNDTSYFQKSMYKMSKRDNMLDDLIVTGGHSILVDSYDSDEVKNEHKHLFGGELDPIDDKFLLLAGKSKLFEQIQGDELFDIYHLCLEGDTPEHDKRYGIWANGVLTESTYKKIIYDVLNK